MDYEALKAKRKGDTLFLGPRDPRSPPRGEVVVVKRGIKWLYLAKQSSIDAAIFRNEDPAECHQDRVMIERPRGDNEYMTTGYPPLRVYLDASDYEESSKRDQLRRKFTKEYSSYFTLENTLKKATYNELVMLTNLFAVLAERDV